ncbi:MAG TPA: hypothetical protein VMF87_20005 [Streptosporangiaceae bacterium]|nr:hypothetical protein [Streptosporangiaceae bacterium]
MAGCGVGEPVASLGGAAEAQASGDPLRLAHLFGISDPTAIRYCADADGNGLGRPLPAESSTLRQVR